jgi:hypothetical protein
MHLADFKKRMPAGVEKSGVVRGASN